MRLTDSRFSAQVIEPAPHSMQGLLSTSVPQTLQVFSILFLSILEARCTGAVRDLTARGEGITHSALSRAVVRRGPGSAGTALLTDVWTVSHRRRPTVRLGVVLFVLHTLHISDFRGQCKHQFGFGGSF